jgi:hypothetical protein
MVTNYIDNAAFKKMLLGAAANLENNKAAVDALNVFPVPDGDTGTNMNLTVQAAIKEINNMSDSSIYFPGIFNDIPADTECTFWVNDEEVSEESVARDIYVSGTRIRVERLTDGVTGGTMETGRFEVSEDGRVY